MSEEAKRLNVELRALERIARKVLLLGTASRRWLIEYIQRAPLPDEGQQTPPKADTENQ